MVSGNSLTEIRYKNTTKIDRTYLVRKNREVSVEIKAKNPVIKLDFLVHLAQFFLCSEMSNFHQTNDGILMLFKKIRGLFQ